MSKKAYLVEFSVMTRIIFDDNNSEEDLIKEAAYKLNKIGEAIITDDCISIEEDFDIPYNNKTDY